jgi:excisionase family DNA binding protein
MLRRRNSLSARHVHDGELPLVRVADIGPPSDPATCPSTATSPGRGKRVANAEPSRGLKRLPSRQRQRPSARENRPQRLLSIRDVAEILSISGKTVYRLIDNGNGELRTIRIGGAWRIDPADLQDFIRDRRSP